MLGPLPKLHRLVVCAVSVLLFVGAGAWAAHVLPHPFLVSGGAAIGLSVGAICAYLLLHGSEQALPPHPARRHRLH